VGLLEDAVLVVSSVLLGLWFSFGLRQLETWRMLTVLD
jgi:hypothetical protein